MPEFLNTQAGFLYEGDSTIAEQNNLVPTELWAIAGQIKTDFQLRMHEAMERVLESPKYQYFTPNVKEKMLLKGYDMPEISILHGVEEVGSYLQNIALLSAEEVAQYSQDFLLVIQLPKPLARFWNCGGSKNWKTGEKVVGQNTVPWGFFYRQALPAVWDVVDPYRPDQVGYNSQSKITLHRLNKSKTHDPKHYYYIYAAKSNSEAQIN